MKINIFLYIFGYFYIYLELSTTENSEKIIYKIFTQVYDDYKNEFERSRQERSFRKSMIKENSEIQLNTNTNEEVIKTTRSNKNHSTEIVQSKSMQKIIDEKKKREATINSEKPAPKKKDPEKEENDCLIY